MSAKRIAVIGGGYAGLGCGYKLSSSGIASSIHVYDHLLVGRADASGASAGIMHPMATRGKVIWNGLEGFQLAVNFMNEVQHHSMEKLYNDNLKFKRLLFTDADVRSWSDAAKSTPDLVEIEELSALQKNQFFQPALNIDQNLLPLKPLGVAHIKRGVVVNSFVYLRALWAATMQHCPQSTWHTEKVTPAALTELSTQYDAVIISSGAGIPALCGMDWPAENKLSSLRLVRGHNLLYERPPTGSSGDHTHSDMQEDIYLSKEYLIPNSETRLPSDHACTECKDQYMLCGPSHEHISVSDFESRYAGADTAPDLQVAESQLLHRIRDRYPGLAGVRPVGAVAGTRLVTHRNRLGRLPIVGKLPIQRNENNSSSSGRRDNIWVHGGFGSRGLILHALTSTYLSEALALDDEAGIPSCLGITVDSSI